MEVGIYILYIYICGATCLTVETQLDFSLVARGPKLLVLLGTLSALAHSGKVTNGVTDRPG